MPEGFWFLTAAWYAMAATAPWITLWCFKTFG